MIPNDKNEKNKLQMQQITLAANMLLADAKTDKERESIVNRLNDPKQSGFDKDGNFVMRGNGVGATRITKDGKVEDLWLGTDGFRQRASGDGRQIGVPKKKEWDVKGKIGELSIVKTESRMHPFPPTTGGGGVWSGYWWFGGEENENTKPITGKYFGCDLRTGDVQFADEPDDTDNIEWRYVADKDEDTGEYTLSNRTCGDIVFRIT
jgi:hypothetical protein